MITNLVVRHFRNLNAVDINTFSRVNIFYGQNGAGKTSLLESIYYLGLGRSFRTNHATRIINNNADSFSVFAYLTQKERQIPIGIERIRNGQRTIKINGENVTTISDLAKQLPLQLMSTISYRFFFNGPKVRRQFLDWILFHVEPTFFTQWQALQRILKQRNAAIKAGLSLQQVVLWDSAFINSADTIDQLRHTILSEFKPIFMRCLQQLLPEYQIDMNYHRGWKEEESLATILQQSLPRDRQLGYTQHGPQRADLRLTIAGTSAEDVLSQGQQKLALYAFHLAQGLLLKEKTAHGPIFLIDDITSELDHVKRDCIAQVLQEIDAQLFITVVDANSLGQISQLNEAKLFHVEHGAIASP